MTDTKSFLKKRLSLAKSLLAQGSLEQAISHLQAIVSDHPESGTGIGLLGLAFARQGNFLQALPLLQQAHQLLPRDTSIIANLALALELSGNLKQALSLYKKALDLQPDNIDALINLGDALRQLNQLVEAEAHLRHATELAPDSYKAWTHLGILLETRKDYQQTERVFRRAMELQPNHPGALNNLGGILHKLEKYQEAIDILNRALSIKPDHQQALTNITASYTMCYQYDNATQAIRRALQLNEHDASSWNNYAKLKYELGEYTEADQAYTRALQCSPSNADTLWHKSFASLIVGDYQRGWQEYEAGLLTGERAHLNLNATTWQGEVLTDQTLFIAAEQGLGDEIMFASCLQEVHNHVEKIIYECDSRLVPLLNRSFNGITFVPRHAATNQHLKPDFQIASGSLPKILRQQQTDFPVSNHFLQADESRVNLWQSRYQSLGEGLKIGISWRGGTRVDPLKRSLPLEHWLPLLNIKNCRFIDIQYGDTQVEREMLEEQSGVHIHRFTECNPLTEQDDFAAQLCALDLIISVSNATVHLAGALGQNTWSLLPFVPSWRWGYQGSSTPWYKSVTLFRQPRMNDWNSVINNVAEKLRERSEHA